ncbi:MAG: hypothetical protein IJS13_03120 [Paludibacteraceae bacterium]|nr:hypothetical protein [Paludibacteraceae bacterium]
MNRLYIILFYLLIIVFCGVGNDAILPIPPRPAEIFKTKVILNPDFTGKKAIYDIVNSNVIDSLQHDTLYENCIIFQVDSCVANKLYVKPYWSFTGEYLNIIGWIEIDEHIVTYLNIYDERGIPIYEYPSFSSPFFLTRTNNMEVNVLNCNNIGWIYTSFTDDFGNKISGWISPIYQCPNVYTTCN